MVKNILIKNVSVYDPNKSSFAPVQDILITDGIVAKMEKNIEAQKGWDVVEAEGLCASAGWTDCHTHFDGFDPSLSYPSLGVTRVHDAGSYGANNYHKMHDVISRLPFKATAYLYVGCDGVTKGAPDDELKTLEKLKPEPFYEVAAAFPGEILGAKIRIDPRVNCDTKQSLKMAKDVAIHACLPLIVHPSRTEDSLEYILSVMDKDDVYAHTYSPVAPSLFDENGKIKKCAWDAMKRGVRFDLSHGSNNFNYDIARRALAQDFITETISTDLHEKNFSRVGMDLAGVMTKAIHAGFKLETALNSVITAPEKLLHSADKPSTIEVGKPAEITCFTVSNTPVELADSMGNKEVCELVVDDVATIIGSSLNRSIPNAITGDQWWAQLKG